MYLLLTQRGLLSVQELYLESSEDHLCRGHMVAVGPQEDHWGALLLQ